MPQCTSLRLSSHSHQQRSRTQLDPTQLSLNRFEAITMIGLTDPWFIAAWHPFTAGPPHACPSMLDHRLWQIDCKDQETQQAALRTVWSHKDLSGSGDGNLLLSHWVSQKWGKLDGSHLSCLSQLVIASCQGSVACSQRHSSQGQWETGATAWSKIVFKKGRVELFNMLYWSQWFSTHSQ